MVALELFGNVFRIDLRAPREHATARGPDGWFEHFMTNEDVLFHPEAHLLEDSIGLARGLTAS